MNINVLNHTH